MGAAKSVVTRVVKFAVMSFFLSIVGRFAAKLAGEHHANQGDVTLDSWPLVPEPPTN